MLGQIKNVKPNVKETLRECPDTRDCDTRLYLRYLMRYHAVIFEELTDKTVTKALGAPKPESLSRARRLIQNKEGLYRGTKQIERARREAEVREGINKI